MSAQLLAPEQQKPRRRNRPMTAAERIRLWRHDPRVFVRDNFKITPDPWQDEVLAAFPHQNRIALPACKGPGKTATLAWLILNFLGTRPHPLIPCTSITGENLRDNLWTECARWISQSEWLNKTLVWTKQRIYVRGHEETWFATARAWPKDADAEQQANTLAGFHANYLLFVLDEAGGIPDSVAAAAEGGLATGIETKLVIAGNPTHLEGPLYRAATTERRLWWVRHVTADPDDPNRAPRVKLEWALEQIEKYGKDSVWVQINVYGRFPTSATDTLCALQWLMDAETRFGKSEAPVLRKRLGVDVARFGTNKTVVVLNEVLADETHRLAKVWDWIGMDTTYTAGRVREIAETEGVKPEDVAIDDCGVGGGVTDQLHNAHVPFMSAAVNVGEASTDEYASNLRAEYCWYTREQFREGHVELCPALAAHSPLIKEATTLRYKFSPSQQRKIESKEEYKRRTKGESPDYFDATVLSMAPVVGESAGASSTETPRPRGRFSPYQERERRNGRLIG